MVTKALIEKYLALEESRKSLNRQAAALEKQADEIEAELTKFVRANGGQEKFVRRSGFVLALMSKRCTPKWREEFERIAGIDAAEAIVAKAPTREFLNVEPIK